MYIVVCTSYYGKRKKYYEDILRSRSILLLLLCYSILLKVYVVEELTLDNTTEFPALSHQQSGDRTSYYAVEPTLLRTILRRIDLLAINSNLASAQCSRAKT